MKKEKIKAWLKDRSNLLLLLILATAFIVRLYYFFLTKDQALWWDEASYGTIAKSLITPELAKAAVMARELVIRPIFLPFLWFLLLKLNFSESLVKFLLVVIPSCLSVLFIYLLSKEMFSKRIAITSTLIFSVLWIHLFYSVRILTDVPFLFFMLVSLYYFAKSYKNGLKTNTFFWSIFFLSLSVLMRYTAALLGFAYVIFLIILFRLEIIKKASFWLGGILGLIPMFIFFFYNFISKGSFFPALQDVAATKMDVPFAFYTFGFISHYLKSVFFICFLIGLLIILFELILGFSLFKQSEKVKSNLLLLILLAVTFIFFVFIIKAAEDRYLFVCLAAFLIVTAIGIDYIYSFIKKYNKILALILVLSILAIGMYQQLSFGNSMIVSKKDSFSQMKEAFLWINNNVDKNENLIVGNYAEIYSLYYSERNPLTVPGNTTAFSELIQKSKPAHLLVHAFNPQPEYIYNYPQEHPESFKIVNVFFFSENQPAVVIYKIQ